MLNRETWTVAHRRGLQSVLGLVVAAVLHVFAPAVASAQEAAPASAAAPAAAGAHARAGVHASPAAHATAAAHPTTAAHATGASHAGDAEHAVAEVVPAGPPIPVRLVAEPIGASTVVQRFRLAPKVTEFMVIIYGSSLEGVQLRTPAGQLVTADNIWRVGRWQTGSSVSVISLDWSSAGEWMLLAPAPVSATVVIDPMLVPLQTPETAELGQPTVLRWQLQAGGRALDLTRLAEIVVVAARVVDEAGARTPLAYALEANGIVSVTVPPHGPGIYNVETDIWLATTGQHVLHRLSVAPPVKLQMLGRRAAPTLVVRVQDAGLKREATRAALRVTSSEGAAQTILGLRQIDGSFRIEVPPKAMGSSPGRATLVLSVDGLTKAGQPWQTSPRLLERGVSGSPLLGTGVDLPQAVATQGGAQRKHAAGAHDSNDAHKAGEHQAPEARGLDESVAALLLAGPGANAPGIWHYGGLGLANLLLVGLIWRRHAQRARLRATQAAATASAGESLDIAERDVQHVTEPETMIPVSAAAAVSLAMSTSFSDASAPPEDSAIEPLELAALADLAELAEAQSGARSQRTDGEPDIDVAA